MEIRTLNKPVAVEGRKLSGVVIPYNSDSLDLGGFVERFLPGSVADTIKSGSIEAWGLHDRTKPLASQASGTLRLNDTPDGLCYEMDLPDGNSDADNLISLTSGAKPVIRGASFGFRPKENGQRWSMVNGIVRRDIIAADLEHISPVVTPAYPATTAILRSIDASGIDPAEYGIDINKLAGIFLARSKGLDIAEADRELVDRAVSLLRTTIKTPRLTAAAERAAGLLI